MSTIPSVYLRTSTMMVGNQLLSTLQQTQAQMAKLDSAIGTGIQVSQPSDDPSKAAAIETLQAALEDRTQTDSNLNFAGTVLNQTGAAVPVIMTTMAVYLVISLAMSLAMNIYNRHLMRVER